MLFGKLQPPCGGRSFPGSVNPSSSQGGPETSHLEHQIAAAMRDIAKFTPAANAGLLELL
jgi:hypothetical protein